MPQVRGGGRVSLLRSNSREFPCGFGTVLLPDCGDGWSLESTHVIKFHRTILEKNEEEEEGEEKVEKEKKKGRGRRRRGKKRRRRRKERTSTLVKSE